MQANESLITLLAFIKKLSEKDPKTLAQKTLKTAEEVGELAKAVLPFEKAPQNQHRFSDRAKINEEVADVILCALSVAFNLGLSNDEIIAMLWQKSEYWASLQARETKNPFPLPFELHVTVEQTERDTFIAACQELGVKPILLDLQNQKGVTILKEVMTTSKFFGDNQQVYNEIQRISSELRARGFKVVREKIETVPWHPSAPSIEGGNKKMGPGGYFECHLEVTISEPERKKLLKVIKQQQAHLSRNARKKFPDGTEVLMVTLRSYKGFYEDFKTKVEQLKAAITKLGINPQKEMVEFSLYDTKVSHDTLWIGNK